MEILSTTNGYSLVYVDKKQEKEYLEKNYGKKCITAVYYSNGKESGWNANIPKDDIGIITKKIKSMQ